MKRSLKLSIILGLVSIIILVSFRANSLPAIDTNNYEIKTLSSTNYTPHDPIIIDSNDDFISYGFPGNGTSESPYLLTNYSINTNAEYGIKICCVSKVYSIQNCFISLTNDALTYGIYLQDSQENCSVINNTVISNDYGIFLNHANTMNISSNLVSGNVKGLYAYNSYHLSVSNNSFTDNYQFALDFYDCVWLHIFSNLVYENRQIGIKFNIVDSSLITQNSFTGNYDYAVYIKSFSDNNGIYLNNFTDNAQTEDAQAYDSGENIWYNEMTLIGNIWSDIGLNCYYILDGSSSNIDLYPINKVENCTNNTSTPNDSSPTSYKIQLGLTLSILILTFAKIRRRES